MPYDNEGGIKQNRDLAVQHEPEDTDTFYDNAHSWMFPLHVEEMQGHWFEWDRVTSGVFMFNRKLELNQVKRVMAYECLL